MKIPNATDLNLDAMPLSDLEDLARALSDEHAADALFPRKPNGYKRAAHALEHYAWNKSIAIRARLRGDLTVATTYETICDQIYRLLPSWAKGW